MMFSKRDLSPFDWTLLKPVLSNYAPKSFYFKKLYWLTGFGSLDESISFFLHLVCLNAGPSLPLASLGILRQAPSPLLIISILLWAC